MGYVQSMSRRFLRAMVVSLGIFVVLGAGLFFLPTLMAPKEAPESEPGPPPFPVTVDPKNKTITEDPTVEALFLRDNTPLSAAVSNASAFFELLAEAISSTPVYQLLAATDSNHIIIIHSGYRKEQAAQKFAKALAWDTNDKKAFLESIQKAPPYFSEGTIAPGTYALPSGLTSEEASVLVRGRFADTILSRYATSTNEVVPLLEALTIASIIERETSDKEEMRIISGILWNRIFTDMKLQADSTLQYAKGTSASWWPIVRPQDKFITSPYNTYVHAGLPPAPIANPSVAAVLAALNPKKTECLFFFHRRGQLHCSVTYAEHVTLLKKYYGQGR